MALCFSIIASCKKESKAPVVVSNPPVNLPVDTSYYKCSTIPAGPAPSGWRDSTTNPNQNINTFLFNPANPDEVVLVVNGDRYGYNKMYAYNIPASKLTFIATVSDLPPSVNKYGWVLFADQQNNIYKVKCNGDSMTKLSSNNYCSNPQWDSSGVNYYYFQEQYLNVQSQIIKADAGGGFKSNMLADVPYMAVLHKSGKIIYMKVTGGQADLYLRNMSTQTETLLLSGPYNGGPTSFFDNLTTDTDDNYFYWSNSGGIFRCSFTTLQTDTVLKNCDNVKYDNPVFQAVKPGYMLVSCQIIKPINVFQLLHSFKAIEYNIGTKERIELKVFN